MVFAVFGIFALKMIDTLPKSVSFSGEFFHLFRFPDSFFIVFNAFFAFLTLFANFPLTGVSFGTKS